MATPSPRLLDIPQTLLLELQDSDVQDVSLAPGCHLRQPFLLLHSHSDSLSSGSSRLAGPASSSTLSLNPLSSHLHGNSHSHSHSSGAHPSLLGLGHGPPAEGSLASSFLSMSIAEGPAARAGAPKAGGAAAGGGAGGGGGGGGGGCRHNKKQKKKRRATIEGDEEVREEEGGLLHRLGHFGHLHPDMRDPPLRPDDLGPGAGGGHRCRCLDPPHHLVHHRRHLLHLHPDDEDGDGDRDPFDAAAPDDGDTLRRKQAKPSPSAAPPSASASQPLSLSLSLSCTAPSMGGRAWARRRDMHDIDLEGRAPSSTDADGASGCSPPESDGDIANDLLAFGLLPSHAHAHAYGVTGKGRPYRHARDYISRHLSLVLHKRRARFPSGRAGHAVAVALVPPGPAGRFPDAADKVKPGAGRAMVIFGGYAPDAGPLDDVWLLPLAHPRLPTLADLCLRVVSATCDLDNICAPPEILAKLRTNAPPPRTALVWEAALRPAGHPSIEARTAAAATAIGKKLWVFGGVGNFRHMSAFNLVKKQWKKYEIDGGPGARHSLTINSLGKSLYLFGGTTQGTDNVMNDLWEFKTEKLEWRKLMDASDVPARQLHTAGFIDEKLVICGGERDWPIELNRIDVVHVLRQPVRWYSIPPHRIGGSMPIASTSTNALCFAGYNLFCLSLSAGTLYVLPLHELTEYDLERESGVRRNPEPTKAKFKWRIVRTQGDTLPFNYTNASLCACGNRLVLFGGCRGGWVNDTYLIDVDDSCSVATITNLKALTRSAEARDTQ